MSFLGLAGRRVLVCGLANRKSVAAAVGRTLAAEGAQVIYTVHRESRRAEIARWLPDADTLVFDAEDPAGADRLAAEIGARGIALHGVVHSIAFANYRDGFKPFHETHRDDFLQAVQVSAFSLVELARALKPHLDRRASVVTIGISSLLVTADNYGYMSPIKAALEGIVRNLAKSFSADTEIRFNAVGAGPLKTASSSGIPGYVESYLFAEKLTFRKRNLDTQEVANVAAFLVSERSSGLNGTTVVVDAGLGLNYFDRDVIRLAMRPDTK